MDQLAQVSALQQQGRFAKALTLLESARVAYQDRQEAEVLRGELSERSATHFFAHSR